MARPKVSIIGAGAVGTATAHWLAQKSIADIVLTDIIEGLPEGKALDIQQAGPIAGFDVRLTGTSRGYEDTAGSAVIVITAGIPRKPGMTRERILGQSGALDTTRFRTFLAMELGVSAGDVDAMVIGAHTDKDMVPLASLANVRGIPVRTLLPPERGEAVVARTRRGGAEITELMKQSGFTAAGAALVEMIEAVLLDRRRGVPCSVYLDGESGQRDLGSGVPVIVGAGGMERILDAPLTDAERQAFTTSVAVGRGVLASLKLLGQSPPGG